MEGLPRAVPQQRGAPHRLGALDRQGAPRRWITATVAEHAEERYRQEKRGRPGKDTRYRKTTASRYAGQDKHRQHRESRRPAVVRRSQCQSGTQPTFRPLAAGEAAPSRPAAANKGRRFLPETLSEAEVSALIRAASGRAPTGVRNRALMVVLYRGGLRVFEALARGVRDVDVEASTIRVRHGKGDRSGSSGSTRPRRR